MEGKTNPHLAGEYSHTQRFNGRRTLRILYHVKVKTNIPQEINAIIKRCVSLIEMLI